MLATVDWPTGSVPPGAFTDVKQVQDRVLKVSVNRGEAVLDRKLMPIGAQGGLSAVIAEGKRAMTVRVNDVVGVAGFALPGNYVDVLVNARFEQGKGEISMPVSLTVLEHVLVLAVAQEASRDDTKPKVVSAVTLELSPEDAEKLDLARSVGTLSLALRNQLDKSKVATAGVSKEELFRLKEKAVQVAALPIARPIVKAVSHPAPQALSAAHSRDCVEVIRNGTTSMSCF
jgi:pilus assembly protein CpaB